MAQQQSWEKEYANRHLVTGGDKPLEDLLRFLKWLKKEQRLRIEGQKVLDLGSGIGKNANYLARLGAEVTGIEIARNAIDRAWLQARQLGIRVDYRQGSIGERLPFPDQAFDLALDITSSNSLTEAERQTYLLEAARVLKSGAFLFVRALCKDGDKNAKQLIKDFPGPESDTYILKGVGITERVFTEADFRRLYSQLFEIVKLEKKSGYQRLNNQSYKRNYWLAYLAKK